MSDRLRGIAYLLSGIAFNVSGQLLLKQAALAGAGDKAGALQRSFLNGWFLGGLVSLGLSMIVWVLTLRRMPLNLAHPVTIGSCLVLVAFGTRVFWDEPMPLTRIAGIAVIVAGVVLVARDMK